MGSYVDNNQRSVAANRLFFENGLPALYYRIDGFINYTYKTNYVIFSKTEFGWDESIFGSPNDIVYYTLICISIYFNSCSKRLCEDTCLKRRKDDSCYSILVVIYL